MITRATPNLSLIYMLIMDRECQSMTVAFLLFDGMQLLDFANPWEVFGIWNRVREMSCKNKVERIKFGMDSKNNVSKLYRYG